MYFPTTFFFLVNVIRVLRLWHWLAWLHRMFVSHYQLPTIQVRKQNVGKMNQWSIGTFPGRQGMTEKERERELWAYKEKSKCKGKCEKWNQYKYTVLYVSPLLYSLFRLLLSIFHQFKLEQKGNSTFFLVLLWFCSCRQLTELL